MLISIIQNILLMTSAFSGIDTLFLLWQTAAQKYNHTSWVDTHARAERFKYLYLDVRPLFS
jgi:hypothetical protein